ncbi:hypothetical protein ERO13_A02G137901v2 [Gossypium hirsutum]|uniref:MADS-box domain-containing protein n=1 Tax=Gossypium tomentosum TaxID=34277 RepID=A0A5D2RLV5_GOSTO|nr:hypothetical protein ERO13_A02G137901v2 [Gossypium hirsutum]TYI40504.1 hypothetical protein ES332_A02G167800v1 [Gossypium tomentosum]
MGRGKLIIKFIMKDKVRILTYEKRKKGLIKKAQEFSILCGVETCVILYAPKSEETPAELEIWPPDHAKPLYVRKRKCFNVLDFCAIRRKKLDDEICKLRKANTEAKFSVWDDNINSFSVNQLSALLSRLDSNLETARKMIKGKHQSSIADSTENQLNQPSLDLYNQAQLSLFQRALDMEITKQQHPMFTLSSSCQPFSSNEPLQWQSVNMNPIDTSTAMVSTNGTLDFTQADGECSSSTTYRSLSPQTCYDPTASMVDNVVLSNSWGVPVCFYGQLMPPMTPFASPTMSSFPSQAGEFYRNVGDRVRSINKK